MKKLFLAIFAITLLLSPSSANAGLLDFLDTGGDGALRDDPLGLNYGEYTGLDDTDPRITVARLINTALSLLGIIAVSLIIYAGFMWMTAGGNEEKTKTARQILIAAVIGLIIILSAYTITRFTMESLYSATQGNVYGTP
jgi:amino acid transporter